MNKFDYKAEIWDQRNKGQGEPYKRFVTDPLILRLCQPIKNKVVMDQGCGNGHLAKKICRCKPKKLILLDFFEGNLLCAAKNLEKNKFPIILKRADLNKKISLPPKSVDIVTSSMVLSEILNYQTAIKETYRLLKRNGIYIIALIHPVYNYKKYLTEKLTGQKSKKITPSRNYFDPRKSNFILGLETHSIIKAPHYNRAIQDYADALSKAGFKLWQIYEPQIPKNLLRIAPRFKTDLDCPIALIIKAKK